VAVREQAKLGILFASVLAATLGALLFRFFSRKAVA
jgi:Na+/H+ antiporter NhaA